MGPSSSSPKDQGNSLQPSDGDESPDESSWTYYLEDFSQPATDGIRSVDQKEDSSRSRGGSPSLISDAASMAATWQVTKTAGIRSVDQKEDSSRSRGGSSSLISDAGSMAATWQVDKNKEMWLVPKSSWQKLSFKKRRNKSGAFEDDDLQDTATSPVNSPKISEMKFFEESTDMNKKIGESDSKLQERTSTHQEEAVRWY